MDTTEKIRKVAEIIINWFDDLKNSRAYSYGTRTEYGGISKKAFNGIFPDKNLENDLERFIFKYQEEFKLFGIDVVTTVLGYGKNKESYSWHVKTRDGHHIYINDGEIKGERVFFDEFKLSDFSSEKPNNANSAADL